MLFLPTTLHEAWVVELEKRGDARGFFARTMCKEEFEEHGLRSQFVQQNASASAEKGTLRGLHFQRGAASEAFGQLCRTPGRRSCPPASSGS